MREPGLICSSVHDGRGDGRCVFRNCERKKWGGRAGEGVEKMCRQFEEWRLGRRRMEGEDESLDNVLYGG